MKKYKILAYLILMNTIASLTKTLYPDYLPLGKILGFLQIVVIISIYISHLKKKDFLIFIYVFVCCTLTLFNMTDVSIDIENIIFLSSTVLILGKFSNAYELIKLGDAFASINRIIYYTATMLLGLTLIGYFISSNWHIINGVRVFYGFCESGHKLSGNMCLIGVLYLIYFKNQKFKIRQLIYFVLPFIFVSLSGSRTYLVSYIVVLLVLYHEKLKDYKLKEFVLPIVIIGGIYFLLNSSLLDRFISMGNNQFISSDFWEATSSGRLIWWEIDIVDFLHFDSIHKMFGKGFSYLYQLNYREYGLAITAHNDFITLAVSLGLFGFLGYVIIMFKWILKKGIDGKIHFWSFTLCMIMFLWNAMISGFFSAQQFMFANLLVSVLLVEHKVGGGEYWKAQ